MPRYAHLYYPGGVFHVVTRTVGGKFVFDAAGAREDYLGRLGDALGKTDAQLLSYCVMSNHVHLVLIHGQMPLEGLFKRVHVGLASSIHRVKGRRRKAQGAVFADRPRRVLVEEDAYLLSLVRYVHNNPVRGGVVRHAVQSDWSSHRAYVGEVEAPEWLRAGYVLGRFGKQGKVAAQRFDAFVREGEKGERNPAFAGEGNAAAVADARATLGDGWRVSDAVLGGEVFLKRVARDVAKAERALGGGELPKRAAVAKAARPALREVVDLVCTSLELEPWEFESRPKSRQCALARQLIVWLWVHKLGGKAIEVARELRAATGNVSRWYSKAMTTAGEMEELASPILLQLKRPGGRIRGNASRVHYQVAVDE